MGYPSFVTGEVLTAADMNAVGLWRITGATITSQGTTATNVTSVFDTSLYDHYRLAIYGDDATSSPGLRFRLLSGTTPASTNYFGGGVGSDWASNTTVYFERSNAATQLNLGSAGNQDRAMFFDIMFPNDAEFTSFGGHYTDFATGYNFHWGGMHQTATAYNGFQFFTSAGTIRLRYALYGYKAP